MMSPPDRTPRAAAEPSEPALADSGSAGAMSAAELDSVCLHNLLDGDPESVFFKDAEGRYLRLSRAHAYGLGLDDVAAALGRTAFDVLPADEAERSASDERSIMRTGVPVVELQEHLVRQDGEESWRVTSKQPLRGWDGDIIGTFGVTRDITARKLMERRLQAHADEVAQANAELLRVEAELRTILESSPDAIVRYDRDLRVSYANSATLALAGVSAEHLVGRDRRDLQTDGEFTSVFSKDLLTPLLRVLDTGQGSEHEYSVETAAGTVHLNTRLVPQVGPDGDVVGVIAVSRDLTDRKRAEDLLADRAVHDPLTGLANRVLLTDRLHQSILRLEREPGMLAVMFLDLDHFKVVNDSLGHGAGDALLVDVAQRICGVARRIDTVARFGGDEFVVLCERLAGIEDAALIAERIAHAVAAPTAYDGRQLHPTASIGIATTWDSGTTAEILIRDAEAAMYQAKDRGRGHGSYHFFDAGVRERAVRRLVVEHELREALDNREFTLQYQPLWRLPERRVSGFEALIRWERPEGIRSPAEFIPVAEESGLIVEIGQFVLDEALRRLSSWNAGRHGRRLTMAVNLSARQLSDPGLVDDVAAALVRHDVAPELLTLEVTETALLEEGLSSAEAFDRLSRLGVRLALDDFGTGYSSLGHLRRYPVDILKIDRMFVEGLDRGQDQSAIVGAVTAMAHALGITTVGEGIETDEQLVALERLGCDEGQGYLLARPMKPDAVEQYLGSVPERISS
jgi:diguanylate cyclase (GGDEF)-like protein/PAS domain S-box-containing protein